MAVRVVKRAVEDPKKLTGPEKAAIILLALGEDHHRLWQSLDEDEIKEISQAMSSLGTVTSAVVEQLLIEFVSGMSGAGSVMGSFEQTQEAIHPRLRRAAFVGDGEIEAAVRCGATFEVVAAVAGEVLSVPPEARADGDVIAEEFGAMQEGIDHEQASERFTHQRPALAGAIARVDKRDEFGGDEILEAARTAGLRKFGGVARVLRPAREFGATILGLDADDDERFIGPA